MVQGCGNSCVKFILFVTNFIIFLCSGAIFGVCLWLNLDPNGLASFTHVIPTDIVDKLPLDHASIWLMAVVAGLIFVMSFLGCAGAACESRFMLYVYAIVFGILFLAQLAAIIWVLVDRGSFKDALENVMKEWHTKEKGTFEKFEKENNCCGVNTGDPCIDPSIHKDLPGCLDVVWDQISNLSLAGSIIAVCVLIIQAVAIIFSCVLAGASGRRAGYYGV